MIVTGSKPAWMRPPFIHFALLLLLAGALLLPAAAGAEEVEQKRPLVVYGDKFMFAIQEPDGWNADLENAGKLSAGIVLIREGETFEKYGVLIAIRIAKKVDEDTKEDLSHDMREFRKLYPDVQFKDLKAPHPAYASHAKLFAIARSRHDYVTYLNPGPGVPVLFAVTMTTGKREADKNDLQAYRDVVRSLEFIPQEGAAPLR
jgi:hypothetical protein